ncbi:hypothetical protein ABH853_11650 [Pseudomonas sp. 13.2]|uniref:Uncharacterized protein n=1 Tax=Pseudomonas sp. 13.2 TaxID=3144665 RepID=A0AAU7BLC8_9PSED
MKAKAPNFEFDPSIRIFGSGEHLLVVFDSQSPMTHSGLPVPCVSLGRSSSCRW